MTSNRDLDAMIREALSRDEAEYFDQLGEASLPEQLTELFSGRLRWLVMMSTLVIVVFFLLGVYCGYRFYHAEDVRTMLLWGGATAFCMVATMANKMWQWMEMQRNAVSREIKRLELQVAHLAVALREERPVGDHEGADRPVG